MLSIADLPNIISGVLQKSLTTLKDSVARNMQANDQVVMGKTLNSLRVEVDGQSGALWGADHIETLEIGISPERSRQEGWSHVFAGISTWQQARGLGWTDSNIASATSIQQKIGSFMFRLGQTKEVYSSEIDPMIESIGNEIGQNFVNIKIVN